MTTPGTLNIHGQPIGRPLNGWKPPLAPPRTPMDGRHCRLEPVDVARHAEPLFRAFSLETTGAMWTYLPYGPFTSAAALDAWLTQHCLGDDPLFFAVVDVRTGEPIGLSSYLRIVPPHGVIEVGHLVYSPKLQRTPAATEAMFLMMARAFELGYRRYEWKCDALNAPSRAAAERLGFRFEGIFRQAITYKGRNRDTAWYSIIDREWPALRDAYERWLAPENFDAEGRQRTRLADLRAPS